MKILHVVVTENYAGVEKYVIAAANEMSARGHDVSVVGGRTAEMQNGLGAGIDWRPGSTPLRAMRSMFSLGRQDVCHVHMTYAEVLGGLLKPLYSTVLATRHFAGRRGNSRLGRFAAALISNKVDHEIAISQYVAEAIEAASATVILSGVPQALSLWSAESKIVLVMQRLEREKATESALRIWHRTQLASRGWQLVIAGEGSQRGHLEEIVEREEIPSVKFVGWVSDVDALIADAGILLATTPVEAFGLSVAEAMMRGIPVVAVGRGGHCETVGRVTPELLFEPGDSSQAAKIIRSVADDLELRRTTSDRVHDHAKRVLGLDMHVSSLVAIYAQAPARRGSIAR